MFKIAGVSWTLANPSFASTRLIYTMGHSTRTFDEFVAILRAHGIRAIADVRRIPKSRKLPHFADTSLAIELPNARIHYLPFKSLGGRRRPSPNSPNTGWRNESFRGYADYLAMPEFLAALDALMMVARDVRIATLCAEAVPWRCHRSLISDALLIRGWTVLDILSQAKAVPHELTPFARVEGTTITYPPLNDPPAACGHGGLFD